MQLTKSEYEKIRTGTAAPYGYVPNTPKNRFVKRMGFGWALYDKPWVKICSFMAVWPLRVLCTRFVNRVVWPTRCAVGLHQKDMFCYSLLKTMTPWCYRCNKPIGHDIPIRSQAEFDEYQPVINAAFTKRSA